MEVEKLGWRDGVKEREREKNRYVVRERWREGAVVDM